MKYSRFSVFCAAASLLTAALSAGAAFAISADNFLPPAEASNPAQEAELLKVQDPAAVKTERDENLGVDVTTAPRLQDSINSIVMRKKKGCQIARTSPESGQTFVATGMASYNASHKNINASRIEQRNAYMMAFMDAKAEMANFVAGIVFRGANNFDSGFKTLDTSEKSLKNIETELSEVQIQSTRKVLKGYVTYAVFDEGGKVYVSIVSSPKTRGKFSRSGADGVSASSLRDGLNTVIAEVKKGLVPPVGGRVIEVPGTNEVAFVGFGSAVVRWDEEDDVHEKLKLQAERMAGVRARDALAGIIIGDDTFWKNISDESSLKMMKDFERVQVEDQTGKGTHEEILEYEKRMRDFRSALRDDTKIQSLRQGNLPPGIGLETDLDDDEYFAYGIAVYVPSVSAEAMRSSREMDEAQLIQTPASRNRSGSSEQAPAMRRGRSGIVEQNL